MGFETPHQPAPHSPLSYYKTVPMGFETGRAVPKIPLEFIIRQSLWDLKPSGDTVVYNSTGNYKTVPMGFETLNRTTLQTKKSNYKTVPMGFETLMGGQCWSLTKRIIRQSLWDLKLMISTAIKIWYLYYKTVPMGFETKNISFGKNATEIIRQSLWDLKLPYFVSPPLSFGIIRQSLWDLKQFEWEYADGSTVL